MKIHTTQNLSSLGNRNSTNNLAQNELRLSRLYEENSRSMFDSEGSNMTIVSFRASKPNSKDAKKVIKSAKKLVGEIKKNATPEVEKGDKFLLSSFFNALLKVADYETVVQAAIAAVICVLLRPLTIMALPTGSNSKKSDKDVQKVENKVADPVDTEKSNVNFKALPMNSGAVSFKGKNNDKDAANNTKTNNIYASAHSIASGLVGLVTVFILTTPFKKGSDYVMNNMLKELDPKTLKRLWPQLDLKTIVDKAGKRVEPFIEKTVNGKKVKEFNWKNIDGLDFSKEIKNCDMLPEMKQLAEVSEETFKKILGVDVDWAAQKGKSFNDVLTKEGKKLYDTIDFSRLGFKVSNIETSAKTGKEVATKGQVLFKDIDKEFLEEIVSKADENSFLKGLDVNSVFDGKQVKDFRQWKNIDGKSWKLDLDSIFVSSPLETANYRPRTSGRMRFDQKEGIHKFKTYQENGVNGNLGTEITDEMLSAEKSNEALIKALTWLPDLSFRVPIAVSTIALIPWILKNVFGIEKKKPASQPEQIVNQVKNEAVDNSKQLDNKVSEIDASNKEVAFKGKGVPGKPSWFKKLTDKISETMARLYGKPLIESERMAKVSAKLGNWSDKTTQHMTTLGSLITSSVYVQRTLSNKDMDSDRKKTLAINQALCFFVPTAAAYTVDSMLNNWVKEKGYRFTGLQKHLIAKAKAEGKDVAELERSLGQRIKGVRILAGLATFTLIYRYLTPVLITPVANKIGDWLTAKGKKEEAKV